MTSTRPKPRAIVLPYPIDDDHDHHDDINNLGLQADTNMMARPVFDRRRIVTLGAVGIGALLVGCGTSTTTPSTGGTTGGTGSGGTGSGSTSCAAVPTETEGPYPADGSNASGTSGQTANVLTKTGIVRNDLRTSLGTGNTAAGIPLTLTMTLVNTNASCAALSGYAVYLWHCTRDGNYSMYSSSVQGEDYLRGVAVTDSNGQVTFTTIFPACYSGRWPHIHFEVYPSLSTATSYRNKIQTSQIALPETTCRAVYQDSGYSASVSNLSKVTLATDNVFSDGYSTQVPTISGTNAAGYTATITVGLAR